LHQHQRQRRTATAKDGRQISYIEATAGDVALANRLAHDVLGRSLDELPPQTRRVLEMLEGIVAAIAADQAIERGQVRFTRRQVRETTGFGDTQLKIHLARLVELELVTAHRAEKGSGFTFELCWDGKGRDGERFMIGLAEPANLGAGHAYDGDRSGPESERSAPGRPPVGGWSGPGRAGDDGTLPLCHNGFVPLGDDHEEKCAVPSDDENGVVAESGRRRAG
jgi:hypothetical protein